MLRRVGIVVVAVVVSVVGLGSVASAQGPRVVSARNVQAHLDEQATALRSQIRELTSEIRSGARRSAGYRRVYQESTELFFLADHLHESAHGPLNLTHLSEDAADLDRAFHRLEVLVDDLDHRSHFGHGHTGGNGLHARLEVIEDTLHHIQDDLAQLRDRPVVVPVPRRSSGISFDNGRFRVQFGQ